MGCVSSRSIDNEERVQRCKERRRLMKQLVVLRAEFAASQMAYLHALKNTGVTLRQFAESESSVLDLDEISPSFELELPPSPPPPLPPPPPPPPFSPNRRDNDCEEIIDEEEDGDGSNCTPPPPPGSSWNFWDPFDPSSSSSTPGSPLLEKKSEVVEEEEWAETKTEFEEGDEEDEGGGQEEEVMVVAVEEEAEEETVGGGGGVVLISLPEKPLAVDFHDENSSVASWCTKDTMDMAMVVKTRRRKNSLLGILKEIDDYFLKAYDSGREVAILLDSNRGDSLHPNLEESMSNYHL